MGGYCLLKEIKIERVGLLVPDFIMLDHQVIRQVSKDGLCFVFFGFITAWYQRDEQISPQTSHLL